MRTATRKTTKLSQPIHGESALLPITLITAATTNTAISQRRRVCDTASAVQYGDGLDELCRVVQPCARLGVEEVEPGRVEARRSGPPISTGVPS